MRQGCFREDDKGSPVAERDESSVLMPFGLPSRLAGVS
jgi:hypothetical protein